MRISCDHGDPGYANWVRMRQARVLIGGVERRGVVMADEEARTAVLLRLDADGNYILNEDRTEVARDVFYGDVAIVE